MKAKFTHLKVIENGEGFERTDETAIGTSSDECDTDTYELDNGLVVYYVTDWQDTDAMKWFGSYEVFLPNGDCSNNINDIWILDELLYI